MALLRIFGTWLLKIFLEFAWNKTKNVLAERKDEKEVAAKDDQKAKEAIEEVREAGKNPALSPEQKEKEQENAFDKFLDRNS